MRVHRQNNNRPQMIYRYENGKIVDPANDVMFWDDVVEILNHYFVIDDERKRSNEQCDLTYAAISELYGSEGVEKIKSRVQDFLKAQ